MSPRRRGADEPEFTSYYDRPVLKEPVWEPLDIAGYLFTGGLAGASSVLAAAADLTGRGQLARAAKVAGLVSIGVSGVALVHDLGRPARFYNMLRVFKPTSPMSVGSWVLAVHSPLAAVAVGSEVTGLLPGAGRAATVAAAVTGSAVATYTAVLISDTAIPAWHGGHRQMPFVFAGSAASAAAGLGLQVAPVSETGPVIAAAVGATTLELAASRLMESGAGLAGEAYRTGRAGQLMRLSRVLSVGGAALAALAGRRSRVAAAIAGTALLTGSAVTRFAIFEAGRQTARDPKYTVLPQGEAARRPK